MPKLREFLGSCCSAVESVGEACLTGWGGYEGYDTKEKLCTRFEIFENFQGFTDLHRFHQDFINNSDFINIQKFH